MSGSSEAPAAPAATAPAATAPAAILPAAVATTPADATVVVDFGAGAIRAAVLADGASWLVPEPVTGLPYWPAAAHWDGQQLRLGTLAERARSVDPDGYWSELERVLTVDAAVSQSGRTLRPVELVTEMLRAVVAEAQRRYGSRIDRALLTVPPGHPPDARHRRRLREAAEAAGPSTVELLPEPVAAACLADPGARGLVLVCDLGAGGLDCTLLSGGAGPEIVETESLEGAGRDLDALLERQIYDDGHAWLGQLVAEAAQQPGSTATVRLGIALTDFARRLKHQLSEAQVVRDAMLPSTPPYRLSRDDLAGIGAPVLRRMADCVQRLLDRAGAKPGDLAAVLLVGGGARMPVVGQWLSEAVGRVPDVPANPELAVVQGAVQWLVRRGRPTVAAEQLPAGAAPLAFAIPGGTAHLVRWLVGPGDRYGRGAVLARIRLPGGGLWDLTAAMPGTVERVLVAPDSEVTAHQWLALTTP